MFDVRGDGVATFTGFVTHNGGQTISSGGMYITTTGLTIADAGMNVYSSDVVNPVALLGSTSTSPGLLSTYSALKVSSEATQTHNLLTATNQVRRRIRALLSFFICSDTRLQ